MPIWSIVKKLIGQDITTVSLPVSMNEPLSALQRNAEAICSSHDLLEDAANCEDPIRRMALAVTAFLAPL